MNFIQKIVKNATLLISMQITTMGLILVFTAYMARALGANDFGTCFFALSLTSLLALFIDLGFDQLSVREISRDNNLLTKFIGNIIPIKVLLSVIVLIIINILINISKYSLDTKYVIYILLSYTILTSFINCYKSVFNAFEVMEYTAILSVIEKVIIVFGGILLLSKGYNLVKVVLIYPISTFLILILCLTILTKKFCSIQSKFDFSFWKYLIIASIPFGIFSMFATINYRIDTIMLSMMKEDSVVGWYNAAYTLVMALNFIPACIINSIFPLLSRLSINSNDSLVSIYKITLKYILIGAIPIATGTLILSKEIIMLIYGEEYLNSVLALQILIMSIVPLFIHNVLGAVIIATDKEKNAISMWAICAIINVMLNYILIPSYSLIGASITTLISETIICTQFYHFVSKRITKVPILELFYKPLFASLVMSAVILFIKNINIYLVIPIAAISYFIALYSIKTFSQIDIELFRKLANKD